MGKVELSKGLTDRLEKGGCLREAFADAVFEGCPIMLNRVEVWGVRGEIAQGATGVGEGCCQGGSLMKAGIIEDDGLARLQARQQKAL